MGEIGKDRLARYLALIEPEREADTLEVIFQRVAGGEGLPKICQAWDVPYGKVLTWLMASADRYSVYQRALEVAAHGLVSEAVDIADSADPETVAQARLRVDTRFKVAKFHAKEMYGESSKETGPVTIVLGESTARAAMELVKRMALSVTNSVSKPPPENVTVDVTPTREPEAVFDELGADEKIAYG